MSEPLYDEPVQYVEDLDTAALDAHAQSLGDENWAATEARWQQEAALQAAQEDQAEAEQLGQQAQLQYIESVVATELEDQLARGEVAQLPADALDCIVALATNRDWCRERGVEPGSHESIRYAARDGIHAGAPSEAEDELEGLRRWQLRRQAGGRLRSAGFSR